MFTPDTISRALDRVLPFVQKPARYTGGEYNSVVKDWEATAYRLALIFPDVYDLGMSNLGVAILYDSVNAQPDMLAERAYTPWVDMLAAMRDAGIPLYGLESRHPLVDFDVLGFSLPYEQLYTNVLTTLDLAGIPLRAADRTDRTADHRRRLRLPQPRADARLLRRVLHRRRRRCDHRNRPHLDRRPPCRLEPRRCPGGTGPDRRRLRPLPLRSLLQRRRDHRRITNHGSRITQVTILKRIVPTLPPPPTKFIVPFIDIVHNRAAIEIQRGCTRGCRFCQAGMVFRPVRERPLDEVLAAVDAVMRDTGFEEISFLSLSSSDYSRIGELVGEVVARHGDEKLSIGLPSLRIETFSAELMDKLEKGRRRSGFTFAPEAATDRLRDVINKPIATEALLDAAREVYRRGWTTIKLYFMIGHPTQTLEDVQAIADLAHAVRKVGFQELGRKSSVRVGVSTLVPKPHTPFQWAQLADESTIREQIGLLERQLRGPGIEFSWNNPRETLLEAALSRGDRRLADVIQRAWELGAAFDGWGDQFKAAVWTQAFADCGPSTSSGQRLDAEWYARRERTFDEILPWDFISVGVNRRFLEQEYTNALQGAVIDDCQEHCFSCGILGQFKDARRDVADDAWGCPPLGKGKPRQPVSVRPVPLYYNEEMSPELAAAGGPRVAQRSGGDGEGHGDMGTR